MAIDKQKLRKIFLQCTAAAAVLTGAAFVGSALYTTDQEAFEQRVQGYNEQAKDVLKQKAGVDYRKFQPRMLTIRETNLAHGIFGQAFDTGAISIDLSPDQSKNGKTMQVFNEHRNRIFIYGYAYGASDFTHDPSQMPQLVRQLTDVWQARNAIQLDDKAPMVSPYELVEGKKFMHYTVSQRGSIMQDYAYLFMTGDDRNILVKGTAGFAQNVKSYTPGVVEDEARANLFKAQLASTVEAQFPDVRRYLNKLDTQARNQAAAAAHYDAIKKENARPHNIGPKPIM